MSPYETRREALARLLAASVMDLRTDPTGGKLPTDCWQQMLAKADAVLFIITPPTAPDHWPSRASLVENASA